MTQHNKIEIFQSSKVRTIWDDEQEKWYFSIVDVVGVLSGSSEPKRYWSDLKRKISAERGQPYENIVRFKMVAPDGKMRLTDVADTEQLFRIIQSIPSPNAEPLKIWMAEVASARLDQMQDPELSIEQAMNDYRRLGYSEHWINQRIKSIEIRKDLTDEWRRCGVEEGQQFATLTDIIYKAWADKGAKEYRAFKGLKKENLRDNMTNTELVLNMLAELSATQISESTNPQNMSEHKRVAQQGGTIARNARRELEAKTGKSVVTPLNASDALKAKKLIKNQ